MKRKTEEKLELVRGSGNVFRDLNRPDADIKQLKGILAAEIIKLLDSESLTVRAAHTKTGIAAADFSRIRNADLARFTVDRLIGVVNRLGAGIDIAVKIRRNPSVRPARRSDAATA
jgi:predicted XRE-type DNA-binding protein